MKSPRHEKVPPAKEEEVKKDATVKTKWSKGNEKGQGSTCPMLPTGQDEQM